MLMAEECGLGLPSLAATLEVWGLNLSEDWIFQFLPQILKRQLFEQICVFQQFVDKRGR